jgi:hypothetical protein
MRLLLAALALVLVASCVSVQSAYDSAARRDRQSVVNARDRQACRSGVARKAAETRAARRS